MKKIILYFLIFIFSTLLFVSFVYAQNQSIISIPPKEDTCSLLDDVAQISESITQKSSIWIQFINNKKERESEIPQLFFLSNTDAVKLKSDVNGISVDINNIKQKIRQLTPIPKITSTNVPTFSPVITNNIQRLDFIMNGDRSNTGLITIADRFAQSTISAMLFNLFNNISVESEKIKAEAQKIKSQTSECQKTGVGITMTPGVIETEVDREKIAVFAPGLFGEEASPEGYKKITPIGFVYTIRDYLFKVSNELFILLVIIGGIFYIGVGIKPEYIKEGHRWIWSAIIGYAVLLVAMAIISALKFLFGAPK